MKRLLVVLIILASLALLAESSIWDKLYMLRSHYGSDEVIFIQDKETGTRCYAITNADLNTSGYAISCVPKGGK